jgi:hypothetical protein
MRGYSRSWELGTGSWELGAGWSEDTKVMVSFIVRIVIKKLYEL